MEFPRFQLLASLLLLTVVSAQAQHLTSSRKQAAYNQSVQAHPADAFVESVGVNTHFIYDDTKYYTAFDTVASRLVELGVRYVRDYPWHTGQWKRPRFLDLYDQTGIRLVALMGERAGAYPAPLDLQPARTQQVIDGIVRDFVNGRRNAIVAFEGPNEYDISYGSDANWISTLRAYQAMLYEMLKQEPALQAIPVLAPTLVWGSNYDAVGELSDFADAANLHPYPGGRKPTNNLDYNLGKARQVVDKAAWVTETGYHNAFGDATDGTGDITHPAVPEEVEARYLPRLFMEYFSRGVVKTFTYELLDAFPDEDNDSETANFGLLRFDLSRKPAFYALARMLHLLEDPGPTFNTGQLAFNLTNSSSVEQLLFQKRDGRFYLVLWQDATSYAVPSGSAWRSGGRGTVLDPIPIEVTLELDSPAARVTTYLPSTSAASQQTAKNARTITLQVPDQVVVVEIEPPPATGVQLDLKLFLEGAYAGQGMMHTSLVEQQLLPLEQPYDGPPWRYAGTERLSFTPASGQRAGDVVDWVLVELWRPDASEVSPVAMQAGLLLKTGQVVDASGAYALFFPDVVQGTYSVIVRHRNHLDITTPGPIVFGNALVSLDFRKNRDSTYEMTPQADLSDGHFALLSGDANADGRVSAADFQQIWRVEHEEPAAYHKADFDLDGVVSDVDYEGFWRRNQGAVSIGRTLADQ